MSQDAITKRWAEPVIPLAIEEETTHYNVINGREMLEISGRFKKKDIERMRLGYVCINCWEPHETPFPERCSMPKCRFQMKKYQLEVFNQTYAGLKRDPRALRIEEGLDRVDDTHERRFYETNSGIIVPRTL
jgi:hypothetical protein